MLTGLRNNIVTNQKMLFLRHEVSISTRLLTLPDRSDYIVVFDHNQWIGIVHYARSKGRGLKSLYHRTKSYACSYLAFLMVNSMMKKENTK